MTPEWAEACLAMTADANAAAVAVLNAGVPKVTVADFHRTGFNIMPQGLDQRINLRSGYRRGPVPGLGDPEDIDAVMFLGLHAASGTGGFLAHTLTSRVASITVNGSDMGEVELFAASLGPYGIRPLFFSGCPVACAQAEKAIAGMHVYAIDKSVGPNGFDPVEWRRGLAAAAAEAVMNTSTTPYTPSGPFWGVLKLRDGVVSAQTLSRRWHLPRKGDCLMIRTRDIHELYSLLIRICYLTPRFAKWLTPSLFLYNVLGLAGRLWVQHRLKDPKRPMPHRD